MVKDNLWLSTGLDFTDGMLCIDCLEKRLERQLNWQDFNDAPINMVHLDTSRGKSERLRSRLINDDGYSRTDLRLMRF